jgi:hypothetical protein
MIKKYLGVLFLLFFGAALFADIAPAEVKADYGGAFRLRQEYWENGLDFETMNKPDRDFFRLRTTLWGKVDLNQDLGAYLRIGNEAKYYLGNYKPFGAPYDGERFDQDELYIDNLYIDAKNIFGLPVDLRIGRQDFLGAFGEGFLILDGTAADGSRTFYFNAAKATVKINKNNTVDLIYIKNPEKDTYLPSWHPNRSPSSTYPGYVDNKKQLNASDEEGAVLYVKSKLNDNFAIEPYYIYKKEDPVGSNQTLKLNTAGARAVFTAGTWKVRGEFAHQFGKYDDTATITGKDRKANGGYIFAGQKYEKVSLKPEWELGYVYLSGDDPTTTEHEGWDPLFSRGPVWNEVAVYPMLYETTNDSGAVPAYWTNTHLYKAGVKLELASATNLALSCQYLKADQKTNLTSASQLLMFSNDGKERGKLATLMLTHAFNKQISGFLQAEYFVPGNFYTDKAQNAAFMRWQLQYSF